MKQAAPRRKSVMKNRTSLASPIYRTKSFDDLLDAIGDGHVERVAHVLNNTKDPSILLGKKDLQGLTPLRKAVALNKTEIARVLVMAGADAMQKGALDKVALHEAALTGQRLLIAPLLASPDVSVNVKDKFGVTPLHNAVRRRHIKAVEWLLFAGADVNCQNDSEESPLSMCHPDSDNEIERQLHSLLLANSTAAEGLESCICCAYVGRKEIRSLGSDGLLKCVTSDLWPDEPQFIFCVKISSDSADPMFPLNQDERFYCHAYKYRLMYALPKEHRRVKIYFNVLEEFSASELILKVSSKSRYLGEIPMEITTYSYQKYINFLASCELDLQNEGQFVLVKRPILAPLVPDHEGVYRYEKCELFELMCSKDTFPPAPPKWNQTRKERAWEEHLQLIATLPETTSPVTEDTNNNRPEESKASAIKKFSVTSSAAPDPFEDENEEEPALELLDWSEPDKCEDFYYISWGWTLYLDRRRALRVPTVTQKFVTEVDPPVVLAITDFFGFHHPSKKMKDPCICQIPKSEDFVKVGTVVLLERQEMGPDEKEDPCPDESADEFFMSEDGRHTFGQVWLERETKRWSLYTGGIVNKPSRIIFRAKKLCTYVGVQLNFGEEAWDSEDDSDGDSDDDEDGDEGEEGEGGEDQEENGETKKKKKKKKKAKKEADEENEEEEDGDQNASNTSRNQMTSQKNANNNNEEDDEDKFLEVEHVVFRGIIPIDEDFALGPDSKGGDGSLATETSSEMLGVLQPRGRSLSVVEEAHKRGTVEFAKPKTEEDFEEDQLSSLLTQVALMWRCRNHREAKVMLFTRHKTDYFYDLVFELVQVSDLDVRAECRWSEGYKMVGCSQPFITLTERLFSVRIEGPMAIKSPEGASNRLLTFYSIYVSELVYEVKRVIIDDPSSKKIKKKEDPTTESMDIDATLELTAFPKGVKTEGVEILSMPIRLTGPNLWMENHLQLRVPDHVLLSELIRVLVADRDFTTNWWKIWILLQFEEKQVDSEKVKQDWPAICTMMLDKWFEQNIDSRDRGIEKILYIIDSLGLNDALATALQTLKLYKLKLQSQLKQPRQLDLLFHWVLETKMTAAAFRRKVAVPPVLRPVSEQFLLYLNELLDPEILSEMGPKVDVEENVINSINGEESIADPRYKTFKVLMKSKQKKDEIVGFTVLLTELVKGLHQKDAADFIARETRRWMASVIDEFPDTCNKLENILHTF